MNGAPNGTVCQANVQPGKFKVPQIRQGLQIYVNKVRLDLDRPFGQYHFDAPLLELHHHNIVDHLQVLPSRSVKQTDFLELFVIYGPQNERTFQQFAQLYPNVRWVIFQSQIQLDTLITFLRSCRGLLILEFKFYNL